MNKEPSTLISDLPDSFVTTVRSWIASTGEVFMVARFPRAAGLREYSFLTSCSALDEVVLRCPIGTEFVAFRMQPLNIRGVVDEIFISHVLTKIQENTEYLIVCCANVGSQSLCCDGWMGDSHCDLREDLKRNVGQYVAVGACPQMTDIDSEEMISAIVGGIRCAR